MERSPNYRKNRAMIERMSKATRSTVFTHYPVMNQLQDLPLRDFRPFVDKQIPFIIGSFSQMGAMAQSASPHHHEFYELVFLTGGEGRHLIDFESYKLEPPMFFFVSPRQVHFWKLHQPLEGFTMLFPEEFLIFPAFGLHHAHAFTFFHSVGQAPYLCLGPQNARELGALLLSMEQEYRQAESHHTSVLRAYLHVLIVRIQRLYTSTTRDVHSVTASSMVRQFKQLVSENFRSERSVRRYAAKIGVSAGHLSDTIKAVTGLSPGRIIRQEIALEAKRLLAHTQLTAAEIGYRLNFEDPAYFGRFFKREGGQSPAAFRQQIREKYQRIRD